MGAFLDSFLETGVICWQRMNVTRRTNPRGAETWEGRPMDDEKIPSETPDAVAVTTEVEKRQVEERVAVGVNVVYEAIRQEGETELHRPAAALAWSALAAGLSMGFSFIAEALIAALGHSQVVGGKS